MSLSPGDHLVSLRMGYLYMHHGIYVAHNLVVHYSGLGDGFNAGPIVEDTLDGFASGKEIRKMARGAGALPLNEILSRAHQRLGENEYSVLSNNCEHFANWCIYGRRESKQIKGAGKRVALGGGPASAFTAVTTRAGSGVVVRLGVHLAGVLCSQMASTRANWKRCHPADLPWRGSDALTPFAPAPA